ncbi:MAG: hypothetical protein Q9180_007895, partial [Flavoplaca navasiana]
GKVIKLYHKAYDGDPTGWQTDWNPIGDQKIISQPAVVSFKPEHLDVFTLDQSPNVMPFYWLVSCSYDGWKMVIDA